MIKNYIVRELKFAIKSLTNEGLVLYNGKWPALCVNFS
jgi:hypothetical protein